MNIKKIILFSIVFLTSISGFAERPYTVLVSFDGFRWDYSHRDITPTLDSIRVNGVSALSLEPVFPTKTFPNHYSIITGMYPSNHGIIQNYFENPFTNEIYRLGDREEVQYSRWYQGEAFWETAERQGITTASYFWPGSEVELEYRRPTFYHVYEHNRPYEERVEGVIDWLQLPKEERPQFITLYFDATDTYGHRAGPYSEATNKAIKQLDSIIALLFQKLRSIEMLDSTNVIIVSDHGMTEVSQERVVNIESMLSELESYTIYGSGPVVGITVPDSMIEYTVEKLQANKSSHYQVYVREEVPEHYHYSNHPFIPPILVIADVGWSIVHNNAYRSVAVGGNHGYDSHHLDMHGIFYAIGPSFKKGYRTGTVRNIDIYPLLCEIFDIIPRQNIDGNLNQIQFILKD